MATKESMWDRDTKVEDLKGDEGGEFKFFADGAVVHFDITECKRGTSKAGNEQAIVSLRLHDEDGAGCRSTEYLTLTEACEWKLKQFFTSLGMARARMSDVVGKSGVCRVKVDNYTNDKGETKRSNKVAAFLRPGTPLKVTYLEDEDSRPFPTREIDGGGEEEESNDNLPF